MHPAQLERATYSSVVSKPAVFSRLALTKALTPEDLDWKPVREHFSRHKSQQ